MATTTNYGWTTPNDTDLVKDGAAAIRTLGSSIDTTTKALNPSTTLGDIEYRSSTANTNTRLGIGATGTVLTVAGGVPTWAAAGGGGANWTLLNSGGTSLSGSSTVTISGISGKDKIMVLVEGASDAVGQANIGIRINGDTGYNYKPFGWTLTSNSSYSTSAIFDQIIPNQDVIRIGRTTTVTSQSVSGFVELTGCSSSGVKMFVAGGGHNAAGGSGGLHTTVGGFWDSSSTVTSVSVTTANSMDAGTVYVYTSA
jgi:hypothetical protein